MKRMKEIHFFFAYRNIFRKADSFTSETNNLVKKKKLSETGMIVLLFFFLCLSQKDHRDQPAAQRWISTFHLPHHTQRWTL